MKASRRGEVGATPEEVWALLRDPYRLPAWWPGVERVEEVSDDAWTKVLRAPRAGKAVRADFTLAGCEEPRHLSWRQEIAESPFERIMSAASYEFDLEPAGETGTRLTLTSRVRLRGMSRLGWLQVRRAAVRRLDEALAGLKELFA